MNHFLDTPFPFSTPAKVAIYQSAHLSVVLRMAKTIRKSYITTSCPLRGCFAC